MGADAAAGWSRVDAAALAGMIAPARTALVVVDAQVDFLAPHGAMAALGLDLTPTVAPLERVRTLIDAARRAGARVALLRVVTRAETDSAAVRLRATRSGQPPEAIAICRAGTPGAGYFGVAPVPGDLEIEKLLYSGFAGTRLDAALRGAGIDTLVVAGFTTDCCVDCTVRDAFHLGYHCFVVDDACAAYSARLHDAALEMLATNCALIVETAAVVAAWSPRLVAG